MTAQIANNSIHEGRSRSRLPKFSEEWIRTIRGSADFFGINYYTSRFIVAQKTGKNPSIQRDQMYDRKAKSEWIKSASEWLFSVPQGFGDLLR